MELKFKQQVQINKMKDFLKQYGATPIMWNSTGCEENFAKSVIVAGSDKDLEHIKELLDL